METTTRRPNVSTPAHWQSALQRAIDQGVTVRQIQCGAWVATSGTDNEVAYLVTATGCECRAAAESDPVCKHRAALRHRLGMLTLDVRPVPAPVVIESIESPDPRPNTCPDCDGNGFVRKASATFRDTTFRVNCRRCRAIGVLSVHRVSA